MGIGGDVGLEGGDWALLVRLIVHFVCLMRTDAYIFDGGAGEALPVHAVFLLLRVNQAATVSKCVSVLYESF